MFFPRLRKQAKWMFVFLALVFGVGFVAFGVGSDLPSGIGDIFRSQGTAGGPSVSEARERIKENPRDAEAHRDLATALQQDGETQEAIGVLERYTKLRPKDTDALAQLGSLYLGRADKLNQEVNAAQAEILEANPGAAVRPGLQAGGQPVLGTDQIAEAASADANERYQRASTQAQTAYGKAVATYERLGRAAPRDPQVQLQLAQTAEAASDLQTAIAAYRRFLVLAPDDANAVTVRQRAKLLERYVEQAARQQAAQQQAAQQQGARQQGGG
jgi:tetratricopeptide (TPR) repeat protein